MRGSRKTAGSKSRRTHTIHVAPITRAVRAALAASAIALVGTGAAYAGDCGNLAQAQLVRCVAPDDANTPVADLTSVASERVPSSVVDTDATGITAQLAASSVTTVNTGTIDMSGSGDVIGIDAYFPGEDVSVVNRGEIYAESVDGLADGIFAYGVDVSVNNAAPGIIQADGYTWAAGIEAQGESVTVNNAGIITATATAYDTVNGVYGHAYGIYAAAAGGDGVVVNNRGSIDVTGPYATGIYAYDGGSGGINVTNRGDITATAADGFATGISAVTNVEGSDITVANRGSIEATGMNGGTGIEVLATGAGSSGSVNNTGDIYASSVVYYSNAEGIVVSADGDASIRNSGSITVGYGDYAYGALALAFAGDADVRNTGDVTVYGGFTGYGIVAASQNGYADATNAGSIAVSSAFGTAAGVDVSGAAGATASNNGSIGVDASQYAFGVRANSGAGDVEVSNAGDITATSGKYAIGAFAQSGDGDVWVDNSGAISTDGKYSFGVLAQSTYGDVTVDNSGKLHGAGKYAYGVVAGSNGGDVAVYNALGGTIAGYSSDLLAVGAFANANYGGSATIDNAGTIDAIGTNYAQIAYGAVVQTDTGAGLVSNGDTGLVSTSNDYGSARGVIVRSSAGGDASVDNAGSIVATATGTGDYLASDAIGVYVYAPGGTASVDNTGTIEVSSASGLADGVFAAGAVADVYNAGSITADGYTWGAGIEAQGDDAASVTNTGDISASATYGRAYGIYATGGDGGVMVDNQGSIAATGPYATGIYAYGGGTGSIQIGNSGDIAAGDAYASIYGTGIRAVSASAGVDISVDNSGSIAANSYYGSTGIDVMATGVGSTGTVVNNGDIQVDTISRYGAAVGVAVSADGDAVVDNAGNIGVFNASDSAYNYYVGTRIYGVQALSFAGDAEVVNSGSIAVDAGIYSYAGYGVVAATVNGTATVDNLGSVDVAGGYLYATGILAQGQAGATASNSGTVTVASDVARYGAFGVQAMSSQGDASVDNSGLISVTSGEVPTVGAFASGATANVNNSGQIDIAATFLGYGAVAFSQDGDAGVTNDGAIAITTTSGAAVGVNVQAQGGATATNTGSIDLTALTDTFGIIATAESGGASVDNSGTITAFSDTPFNGNSNGIAVAAMGDALVDNSGVISATGGKYATGISASSVAGDVQAYNSGSIVAGDAKYATGIEAIAQAGDVLVDNAATGTVSASASNGFAFGVAGVSLAGDVQVDNAGTIAAADDLSAAPYAYAVDVIGIYAVGDGDVSVDNSGAVSAQSTYGLADGIFVAAGETATVTNSGSIAADGYTWGAGIEAQGDDAASVTNTGDISASATAYVVADPEAGTYGVYGHAYGIYATGGDGGVMVDNQGTIAATGPYATGVYAYGGGTGGAMVGNSGDITATADNGFAAGISAATSVAYSDIAIQNAEGGSITANGMNGATGIVALATGTGSSGSVENAGDIYAAATVYYSNAEGIVVSADGDASIGNSGSITVGYGDYAYGALALAFAGDANVDNASSGTIVVNGGLNAYGAVAASQNGYANASNAGSITVDSSLGTAAGINGSSLAGTTVTNSGDINATASKYAFGVLANTGQGDTLVDNSGTIATDGKYSFGVMAQSGDGSATVYNTGSITGAGKYAYGAVAGSNYGDAAIINAEGGSLNGYSADLLTVGAFANANYTGYATISNSGSIDATGTGYAQLAYGAVVQTDAGTGVVSNGDTGTISASNSYGATRGVIVRSSAGGDAAVDNAGSISATSTGPGVVEGYYGTYTVNTDAIGVYAYAPGAYAIVSNYGSITASSAAGLADGVFASGAAAYVFNEGSITADGYTWGAGIEAQGDVMGSVINAGDITATAMAYAPADPEAGTEAVYGHAYGIYATGGDGGVYVNNTGTIAAVGPYATGVYAYDGSTGGIAISNRGDIAAAAENGIAAGINATTVAPDSGIEVVNRGTIDATGFNAASGISALAGGADSAIAVTNAGATSAIASDPKYGNAVGVAASGDGDVSIRNTAAGSLYASGAYAYGALSLAFAGDSDVVNAGDIATVAAGGLYASSYGIVSSSQNGTASATNTGSIYASVNSLASTVRGIDATGLDVDVVNRGSVDVYSGKYSRGINAVASTGDVSVRNQGSVYVGGVNVKYAYGIVGTSTDGDVRITNTADGTVGVYDSGSIAVGVLGTSVYDNVEIVNAGGIVTRGDGTNLAAGVYASSDNNDVSVVNRGSIEAEALFDAIGVLSNIGGNDELSVDNRGTISANSLAASNGVAVGIEGSSLYGGDVVLRNRGTIDASATGSNAFGISGFVAGGGELTLANTAAGSITATSVDGDAVGLYGVLTDSDVTVNNAGSITVSSTYGAADAIRIVDGGDPLAAGDATIANSGSIAGAIVTGSGDDRMTNQRGGTWRVAGSGSDFGGGDDSFTNARGATLELADAGIAFGGGDNRFANTGTIVVSGANTIDMTDGSAAAMADALARPRNGAAAFTNNGILDFLDGAADDSLTITGGFAGRGAINLDVSLAGKVNDQLFVQGGVGNGTKQRVNVALLEGLPKSSDVGTQLELVHVSGDTNPSVFVAGDVLGISPRDFLSMGMTLSSHPDKGAKAANDGSSYLLTVKTHVKGLNAAGVLASSAALGVDSLMTSTIGSWRDRSYSLAATGNQPAFATIVPWVRGFRDEGGMSPSHLSGNFGQMSASRMSQDNFGTEMGLELQALNGFRFGTLFAKSEGKQYLVDERGMDTIRGSTLGLYGTWVSPTGFYVDASWRTMQFEANIDSVGGRQRSDGNAVTTNVEAGYTWKLSNGLNVEPQLRYTSTAIDGLRIEGDQAVFESRDAQWKRASAGFSLWKSFGGVSGWRFTPYGEFSVMRTLEGVAAYTINDDYFGNVMNEGTSALVEFGLGAQKGRFSWNGGFNWMDGATFDDVVGGQMTLRYSW